MIMMRMFAIELLYTNNEPQRAYSVRFNLLKASIKNQFKFLESAVKVFD